jgi:Outer membrane protein beta-barrel domain
MKQDNSDMDDLFKRASEGYPLRTDSSDWDRLASALNDEPATPLDQKEKRRRRGVFWWFLLIPLAGIGYLTWVQVEKAGAGVGGIAARTEKSASSGEEVRKMRTRDSGAALSSAQSAVGLQGNDVVGSKKVAIRDQKDVNGPQKDVNGPQKDVNGPQNADESVSDGAKVRSLRTRGYGGTKNDGSGVVGSDVAGSPGRTPADGSVARGATGGSPGSTVAGDGVTKTGMASPDHELAWAFLDLRRAPIGGGFHVVANVVAPKPAADGTPPTAKKQSGKISHGYIGVFGAPDFSTVRFQSMKGVGTTFGMLLGYSFNDRWAVETGLSLDRKRYYTAGEYFNTKNVTMPPGYSKLLNADGTCYMWEIPVNVRYNFNTSPRMKWFATAGLSTYLMTSEEYSYEAENWSSTPTEGYWNIHKPSQYWFSIINLSAGFEQHLGKIGNLRLEPYVRIPLSGIGTGNLPILSAGVNIGITHQLW